MTPHLQDATLWGTGWVLYTQAFRHPLPELSRKILLGGKVQAGGCPPPPPGQGSVGRHRGPQRELSRDSDDLSTTQASAVHTSDSHLPSTKNKRVRVYL